MSGQTVKIINSETYLRFSIKFNYGTNQKEKSDNKHLVLLGNFLFV